MGKRITIHRPTRLTFEPRPEKLKPKKPPKRAEFYADDVVWAAPGPIRATHVATPEGMRLINEDGSVGPVEEGVAAPERTFHGGREIVRDDAGRIIQVAELGGGRYSDHLTREGDAQFTPAENDALARIVLRDDTLPAHEHYHFLYANGLPVWRVHNVTGEQDAAHIVDNVTTDRWDILWLHAPATQPVHIEHIERTPILQGSTLAEVHRSMHPGADTPLSYDERMSILAMPQALHLPADATDEELVDAQNSTPRPRLPNRGGIIIQSPHELEAAQQKRIHPWVRWLDAPPQRWLKKFRHWQKWEKVGPRRHEQRQTMNWISGWLLALNTAVWVFLVVHPGLQLLQILNQ